MRAGRVPQLGALALALAGCAAAPPAASPLDQELAAILALLPGQYAGAAPDPRAPDAGPRPIYHKLVPIEVPQFGELALYYQLSTGSPDGPALQQKLFVFDTAPDRMANRMQAYVFTPGQMPPNLERRPAEWPALRPADLMAFSDACAFRWVQSPEGLTGSVRRAECAFESERFGGLVRPEMSYRVTAGALYWTEALYAEDGRVLASTAGTLVADRL